VTPGGHTGAAGQPLKVNTIDNDKLTGLSGRQPENIAKLMKVYEGKFDHVNQIAAFEDTLIRSVSTITAGELHYLASLGTKIHMRQNLHTTIRMGHNSAEEMRVIRQNTPILSGASSMYALNQQRFYQILLLMV
jgi:hypothetical protein